MASSTVPFSLIFFFFFLFISSSIAQQSFRPKSLVLPVTKLQSSNQYITTFKQRTPLVPLNLTVDLGGRFLWVNCEDSYHSSSYKPVRCGSAQCSLANSKSCSYCPGKPRPGCNNNTCALFPDNPFGPITTIGDVGSDVISLQSTNGKNPGQSVLAPKILFVCGANLLLEKLDGGVKGMVGLGRGKMGLPSQLASTFSFNRKFAICLGSQNGVIFFGNGPFTFLPNLEISSRSSLIYTPLLFNPVSTAGSYFQGEPSAEYFIGVKAIKINGKNVPINTTLLAIDKQGNGGTKISTVQAYTMLQTSIYEAVSDAFSKALEQVPRVKPVAPFKVCFNSSFLGSTRVGPGVPQIDLVLQNKSVVWRIFGSNSMVNVGDDKLCLGFVDGGLEPRTSIVIGGHQIEDNYLEFDLAASRLGFTSSLLFRQTNCGNFNFTSNV
ncbi:hypothetical protein M9H77_36747 [Catharanthus roseus]|uniref:Uncharacterized protein n=1 Tax=Catharanthus roseus TaxID=4058 RepID=A0ACB9ZUV7_CATRO|nr:hypothetical protein M9H77_36747 [Catharanthus roseus]